MGFFPQITLASNKALNGEELLLIISYINYQTQSQICQALELGLQLGPYYNVRSLSIFLYVWI